jgi:hypothetical protein
MTSYEELKKRVALLKEVDRQENASRKEVAAKEAAEMARCAPRGRRRNLARGENVTAGTRASPSFLSLTSPPPLPSSTARKRSS